jgi:hypothetical protein
MPRIPFDVLSKTRRAAWVEVPADLGDREAGAFRVKLQELPRDEWDRLQAETAAYSGLVAQTAERVGAAGEAEVPSAAKGYATAAKKTHAAVLELLAKAVVDHDASRFEVTPPADPLNRPPFEQELRALGHTEEEIAECFLLGRTFIRFQAQDWSFEVAPGVVESIPGAHPETVLFYLRCWPREAFALALLRAIRRFQECAEVTPESLWKEAERAKRGAGPLG